MNDPTSRESKKLVAQLTQNGVRIYADAGRVAALTLLLHCKKLPNKNWLVGDHFIEYHSRNGVEYFIEGDEIVTTYSHANAAYKSHVKLTLV